MLSRIISLIAVGIAGACLGVLLTSHGAVGPQGPQGPQGATGAQGPAAPSLSYECQELFPMGSSSGTETTMYWPCTNSESNG